LKATGGSSNPRIITISTYKIRRRSLEVAVKERIIEFDVIEDEIKGVTLQIGWGSPVESVF
jgi:hypothetical protein